MRNWLTGLLDKSEICRAHHQEGQVGIPGDGQQPYPTGGISSSSGKSQFCSEGLPTD